MFAVVRTRERWTTVFRSSGFNGRVLQESVCLPAGETVATHNVRETADKHAAKNNDRWPEGHYIVVEVA